MDEEQLRDEQVQREHDDEHVQVRVGVDPETGLKKTFVNFEPDAEEYAQNAKPEVSFMANPEALIFVPLNRPFCYKSEEDAMDPRRAKVVRIVLYFEIQVLDQSIMIVHSDYNMPEIEEADSIVHREHVPEERLDGNIEKINTPNKFAVPSRSLVKDCKHLLTALQSFANQEDLVQITPEDLYYRFPEILDFQSEITRLFDAFEFHKDQLAKASEGGLAENVVTQNIGHQSKKL